MSNILYTHEKLKNWTSIASAESARTLHTVALVQKASQISFKNKIYVLANKMFTKALL